MNEHFLLSKYVKQVKYPIYLFPVDLYFLKHRAESIVKPYESIQASDIEKQAIAKPNYLKKLGYEGFIHVLPVNPISQIFDPEKFI